MNTTFEEIYDKFLAKISDADLAQLPMENIKYHLKQYLEDAIFIRLHPAPKCLTEFDGDGFASEIPYTLQDLVAHAMVLAWLEPKLKHDRILRSAIGGRDYSELSNANQLKALLSLEDSAKDKVNEYFITYEYTHEDFDGFR